MGRVTADKSMGGAEARTIEKGDTQEAQSLLSESPLSYSGSGEPSCAKITMPADLRPTSERD